MVKRISLGIITRNVEDQIEPLLEQCAPYAYEIVVVDSYSHDNTVKLCKKYGARVHNVACTGSFAQMRNILMNLCTGDYVLMLDADETLEDVNKVFTTDYTQNAYSFPRYNYIDYKESFDTYPDAQTRLIKLGAGVTYSNDLHETVNAKPLMLDSHIIHAKENPDKSEKVYNAIKSYSKYNNANILELIDIMNEETLSGWYPAERFANGDMARWASSNAAMSIECNEPAASSLEIKISTFGDYEVVKMVLESKNGASTDLSVTEPGIYNIPLHPLLFDYEDLEFKITGINKVRDSGDSRDLCAFVDYIRYVGDYKSGYMKLLWNDKQRYYIKGFTYDTAIMECIVHSGWWETDNQYIMQKFIPKDGVCVDVGANIGALAIPMATLAKKVYAFEAGPQIYSMLKSNIVSNNINNIEAINVAVSNKKDVVYFHHNTGNVGGSYVTTDNDATTSYSVPAIRFDTWAKQELQRLDFVKCDIEAFEVKFLKGAKQTFKKYKPIMLIEFNPVAFDNNSTDDTAEDLWNELMQLYEYIYVVEGPNTFRRVRSYDEACQRIDRTTRTLEDLLCTHEPVE